MLEGCLRICPAPTQNALFIRVRNIVWLLDAYPIKDLEKKFAQFFWNIHSHDTNIKALHCLAAAISAQLRSAQLCSAQLVIS